MKTVQVSGKQDSGSSQRFKENYGLMIRQPHSEVDTSKEMKSGLKDAGILRVTETLGTEAEMWRQPKCPSA